MKAKENNIKGMMTKFMIASFCVGVLFGIVISSLVVRGI